MLSLAPCAESPPPAPQDSARPGTGVGPKGMLPLVSGLLGLLHSHASAYNPESLALLKNVRHFLQRALLPAAVGAGMGWGGVGKSCGSWVPRGPDSVGFWSPGLSPHLMTHGSLPWLE